VCGFVDDWGIAAVLLAVLALEMVRPICVAWLQSGCRFSVVAISQWFDAGLRPIVALLVIKTDLSPSGLVLTAYGISAVVSVSLLLIYALREVPVSRPSQTDASRIVRYGSPLVANSLFGWLGNTGDRYLIAVALGTRAAGLYVAASALGGRLSLMLGGVIEAYFRPQLYLAVANRDSKALNSVSTVWQRKVLVAGASCFVLLLASLPVIRALLLGAEFRAGSAPIIVLSYVAYWIASFGFMPIRINYAYERTDRVAIAEVVGMAVMIGAVSALGHELGLAGAALGLVVSGVCRFALARVLAARTLLENQVGSTDDKSPET
jgi:O-antigen/teichoic acid export membrane protein